MVRVQHSKDRLHITPSEWKNFFGGKKDKVAHDFKRLPFNHCSLSLVPFEHPYCDKDGVMFDLASIVPFLRKYGISPVDGSKMTAKDLIKLNFIKNAFGEYHCPVTYKVFNETSFIVAIRTTGNVFINEAVEELNIKAKYYKDLLTDEPFTRADIIVLQDPKKLDKFNLINFYHMTHNLKWTKEEEEEARKDPTFTLRGMNAETSEVLSTLKETYKKPTQPNVTSDWEAKFRASATDTFNADNISTGKVAASLTSTAFDRITEQEHALIDDDTLRYSRVKKKAYVRLVTNLGLLNLELHSDKIPKTCENFIVHCQNGYYDNTIFHRSIKNFMIQGGDPAGTGLGGESIWEKPFKDEIKSFLKHEGRGIVSMANSGPNTNKSQFFITFRSCKHLNGKHTVFGKVVGGLDTLDKMEMIATDEKDRPESKIKLISTQIFVNPYEEAEEQLEKEREEFAEKEKLAKKPLKKVETSPLATYRSGVGKYINPSVVSESKKAASSSSGKQPLKRTQEDVFKKPAVPGTTTTTTTASTDEPGPSRTEQIVVKKKKTGFGDFSTW